MSKPLSGRTALVTGSTSGIGLAIATTLAEAGARIGMNGLGSPEQIKAAEDQLRKAGAADVRYFDANLMDQKAIDTMMDAALGWGSGVDILVNNAGMQHTASVATMPVEKWQAIIALNLSACFYTMRRAMPAMAERGYGRVINIASVHGLVASIEKAPYVSSKFGLVGLTKVAALEYAAAGDRASGGVTVNAICPGWVETPLIEPQIMARAQKHGGDRAKGYKELVLEKEPSGRMADPADIGALALFLCSKAAHNITGTAIPVDGGWTAQ
jgi:3-hydroxybutyrate dehydrogenase